MIVVACSVSAIFAWLVGYYVGFLMDAADAQIQELNRNLSRIEQRVREQP